MADESDDLTHDALELVAARFRALSEPARLRVIYALRRGESTVTALGAATGLGQANLSKHLSVLLEAGFVARRKDGMCSYYRVADATTFALCDTVCASLSEQLAARRGAVESLGRADAEIER